MRKIRKTHPPRSLEEWKENNKEVNHKYEDLPGNVHQELHQQLLKEQGYIDAYTGQSIHADTSHIEHLKPQNKCVEWEDVDYRNVVACFPKDGGDKSWGYGAPVKSGWWDEELFISPLNEECERRYVYKWSGIVEPFPDGNEAAKTMIEKLGLNHKNLRDLREAHIKGFFGFSTKSKPLTTDDAKTVLENICEFNNRGELIEFCFVLRQLLPKYISGESS